MKRIGLISDTHSYWENDLVEALQEVDEIWHGGDVGDVKVIDELEKMGKTVRGVYGNIDDATLRMIWPKHQLFEIEGLKVFIIHIAGKVSAYNRGVRNMLQDEKPNILVCGHSHILKVDKDERFNCLYLNPGACGNHGFHPIRTLLRFSIDNGKIKDMEAVELGRRGKVDNYQE